MSSSGLLTWLLFFGNGFFRNEPVCAKHYSQYNYNNISFHNADYRLSNMMESPPSMNCNCSWGTVPGYQPMTKIVGGKPVGTKENYPMMAGIQDNFEECMICGGSILTEYHVLTAAHCVFDEDVSTMSLVFGVKNRCRENNNKGQYIPILPTLYIHEYYDHADNHNDIAIILAAEKIMFTPDVGPACIHTQPVKSLDDPILILGWGKVKEGAGPSRALLKVFVNWVSTSYCKTRLPIGFINDNFNLQLCTYGGEKDACGGDSGGPLFMVDHNARRLVQIAVVSMGKGCGRIGTPAVNTALYPYLGWMQWTIENSMRKHFYNSYSKCGASFCYVESSGQKVPGRLF